MYIKLTQNEVMKLNEKGIFFLAIQREGDMQVVYLDDNSKVEDIKYKKVDKEYQNELNSAAKAYLKDTDWYITREAETNQAVPKDVMANRAVCRGVVENG
jgi:hypothetical protein